MRIGKALLLSLSISISLLFCFGSCAIVSASASASEFTLNPKKTIEALLAFGKMNRIKLEGGLELLDVVGDESKYKLYRSSDSSNIFVVPTLPVGEILQMSFVMVGGQAQDVRFTISDATSNTIFIGTDLAQRKLELQMEFSLKVDQMLEAMTDGRRDKYYVIDHDLEPLVALGEKGLSGRNQLDIYKLKTYKMKELTGLVLLVKNNTKTAIQLGVSDFKGIFKGEVVRAKFGSKNFASLEAGTRMIVCIVIDNSNEKL